MQRLRRDLADLDEVLDGVAEDLLEGGNVPFLDGDAATMETARRALRRLPKQLLKRLWTSGAKVELRPVKSLHRNQSTSCPAKTKPPDYAAARLLWLPPDAATSNARFCMRRATSSTTSAATIVSAALRNGKASGNWNAEPGTFHEFAGQQDWPSEYFAESFAAYWTDDRAKLSPAVRDFIGEVSRQ